MHNILYRNWEQNVTGLYKVSKINTRKSNVYYLMIFYY